MKRKLSNQFLRNFLVIFLLTILDTVLINAAVLCQRIDIGFAGKTGIPQARL